MKDERSILPHGFKDINSWLAALLPWTCGEAEHHDGANLLSSQWQEADGETDREQPGQGPSFQSMRTDLLPVPGPSNSSPTFQ